MIQKLVVLASTIALGLALYIHFRPGRASAENLPTEGSAESGTSSEAGLSADGATAPDSLGPGRVAPETREAALEILDRHTKQPIEGARVRVLCTDGREVEGTSDVQGKLTITTTARYAARVQADGYADEFFVVTYPDAAIVRMSGWGRIEATVTDEFGQGRVGTQIAYLPSRQGGRAWARKDWKSVAFDLLALLPDYERTSSRELFAPLLDQGQPSKDAMNRLAKYGFPAFLLDRPSWSRAQSAGESVPLVATTGPGGIATFDPVRAGENYVWGVIDEAGRGSRVILEPAQGGGRDNPEPDDVSSCFDVLPNETVRVQARFARLGGFRAQFAREDLRAGFEVKTRLEMDRWTEESESEPDLVVLRLTDPKLDRAGHVEVAGLEPGTYRFQVSWAKVGVAAARTIPFEITSGELHDFGILSIPPSDNRLRVRFVDELGQAVDPDTLFVDPHQPVVTRIASDLGTPAPNTSTTASMRLSEGLQVSSLEPGAWTLQFELEPQSLREGWRLGAPYVLFDYAPGELVIDYPVGRASRLVVRPRAPLGEELVGARAWAIDKSTLLPDELELVSGEHRAELAAGSYTIVVTGRSRRNASDPLEPGWFATRDVEISAESTNEFDVLLEPGCAVRLPEPRRPIAPQLVGVNVYPSDVLPLARVMFWGNTGYAHGERAVVGLPPNTDIRVTEYGAEFVTGLAGSISE